LTFLTEASSVLAASLDYEETLRNVASLAVPAFADWCAVDVVDSEGKAQRLAVAHVDPERVELAYEVSRRYPPDPSGPVHRVIRTGEPMLVTELSDEMLRAAARDEEHYHILSRLGLVSAIIAPFTARSGVLGAISFVWAESNRRYSEDDLALAQDLARRAGVAIENARLYQRERGIAETLQRSLLRRRMPEFPGVSIASRYLPARQEAEIGGDWYDAMALPDGRIALVMGDVAGRGIQAAAVMGQLQNAVRAYALEGHPPAVIMDRVTRLLDIREMATMLYLAFDPATWTVSYANAGHLPPLVVDPGGEVRLLEGGAAPLGSSGEVSFQEHTAALAPGSTIVLYTDGLVEVRGEAVDEGMTRLLRAAANGHRGEPSALLDHLVHALLGGGSAADDVALLALHAAPLDPGSLRLRLDAVPSSMPLLRHTLRRWLLPAEIAPAEVFDITVAVCEAFTNAIEHAYPAADAQIDVQGTLSGQDIYIRVRDWGRWRQPRGTNRGRGLALMRGLMHEVTVEPGPTGTTVHLRRRLRREVPA
jgi:serine phosphatase RsbU (regulator of sigma subunit)/anti-sigma regulatory factor (Ser/Thr protein kinase)